MHSDAQLGQYIPLHYHYQMLLDEARMRGFAQAIAYNVLEGARVLELDGNGQNSTLERLKCSLESISCR